MAYQRPPTFALRGWYPADLPSLERDLDEFLAAEGLPEPMATRGIIAPHAGYRYCGGVAGATYAQVLVPDVAVVLGVDHWHTGSAYATQLSGSWSLPGEVQVPIEEELAARIAERVDFVQEDTGALEKEHSLEMQVPFLWRRRPDVHIVPLQLSYLGEDESLRVGETLGQVILRYERETGRSVLLVASSDMHHADQGFRARDDRLVREKDSRALERILAWDPRGLHRRVHRDAISMCGVVPAVVAMTAATVLAASTATLVRHATSADTPPHNYSYVVGYAGVLLR